MAGKRGKAESPGTPPGQIVDWAVANPCPGPDEVRRREKEDAFQDGIDDLIEARRDAVEGGDGIALLEALEDFCINSEREMPRWLRQHAAAAIHRYLALHSKTLDEAFRLPERIGFAAKSRRARHGLMIYFEICELHWAGVPITQELYHAIGELHGVGRNVVQECYSRELRRRGGRRVGKPMDPQQLPKRLWATYEAVTGKRIETRL